MKAGKQAPRLSEKLNADLEAIRADHRDLINSQLQSFGNDLSDAANNALNTISAATVQLDVNLKQAVSRQKLMTRHLHERAWATVLKGCLMATVLVLLTVTVTTWVERRVSLSQLGIRTVSQPQATYLLLSGPQMQLTRCRVGAEVINCIRIGKE